jgi:hypothetical protein
VYKLVFKKMMIMNKKLSIFLMAAVSAGMMLTSCTSLDEDKYFDDRSTLESVFSDKTQSEEWLAYAFSFLKNANAEVCSKGGTGTGDGSWNPFCFDDDMYYGDRDQTVGGGDAKDASWASYNAFHEGNYDEGVSQDSWTNCYKGIYQASVFIHNIYRNTEMTDAQITDYRGQARFVRAYFYWLLLRKYGPVPIMPDEGVDYTKSYDDIATPRSTYEEVANYISSEMIQAAQEIQYTKRDEGNIARPTKGACLATRAIAYIYAASPLANGQLANGVHASGVTDNIAKQLLNYDGTPLLSLTYDESKWARAAAACKDVMNLGVYQLYHAAFMNQSADPYEATVVPADSTCEFANKNWPDGWKDIDPKLSYANMFNGVVTASDNPELIFTRAANQALDDNNFGLGALVIHEMPVSLGGWNTHGITQKMCDAYYMNDGTDVPGKDSEANGGDGAARVTGFTTRTDIRSGAFPEISRSTLHGGVNVPLMYTKREPRFYASVAYNGATWECYGQSASSDHYKQVFYYRGGGNGYLNNFQYPRTGIGCKKWYDPNDYTSSHSYSNLNTNKAETAIRYADILLMYAEALNELDGTYQIASWDGSTTYSISRDESEMKKGIQPVRIRAGLPDYTEAEYGNKNTLRTKIKRERMIEFMGEGKRYFDLRRWMDAPIEEAKPVYGLNIFMTQSQKNDFMKIIPCSNLSATFSDKMYFWPISHSELKRNKKMTQNPGWTYND